MATSNVILVKFRASGNAAVQKAVSDLAKAQAILTGKTSQYRKAVKRLNLDQAKLDKHFGLTVKSSRLLAGSFATARSQMLLFSFAMSLGGRQLINFSKQAAKVQSMKRAFDSLQGSTGLASQTLKSLKEATNGAMSEFDLFQQANNAMILGITKNSDEMSEMFDMAQRLGSALGQDTKLSVESLITGIGRQSRMMLDNIGIVVDTEKAYKVYADELGINVDLLTDAEKKQAFLNATLDSARQKVKNLPPEVITTQMAFDSLGASLSDASTELGEAFLPLLIPLIDGLTTVFNKIDAPRVQRFATAITVAGAAAFVLSGHLKTAVQQLIAFNIAQTRIGWGAIASAVGLGTAAVMEYFGVFEEGEDGQLRFLDSSYLLLESESAFSRQVQLSIDALNNKKNLMIPFISLNKDVANSEKKLAEQVVKSSFAMGKAYDNTGMAALKGLEKVITAEVQTMTVSLMRKFIGENPSFIGLALAGMASSMVGSLVGQGMRSVTRVAQKFEDGGLVGGRRHSQGGTMIEAEQGEFVMSRNAVDAIGVENLNRMNRGGGGAVNITFTGNVMSQDFIENEAIPQIKEAIRRGADIGVA